jgi:hypothetical protein
VGGCRALAVLAGLATIALTGLAAPPSAPAAPHAVLPDPANLGRGPAPVRDTALSAGAPIARSATVTAAPVRSAGGDVVRVAVSPRFGSQVRSVAQSWANFFSGLVHGSELRQVKVYVAPAREVRAVCGQRADACYSSRDRTLVIPGERPPDGVAPEEIAAHEYGHHIANSRSNAPWRALDWGTKRWSTNQFVCQRVRAREVFPGDEGRRYRLNPGEAFADSYRVLVGGTWSGLFDASFAPTLTDLALIRRDIVDPWRENRVEVRRGAFARAGASVQRLSFAVPLDGRLRVALKGEPGEDLDLILLDERGRRLSVKDNPGPAEAVTGDLCGVRRVTVAVRRASGAGRFRLQVSHP